MILGTSVFLQPRVNSPNTPSWPTEPTTPPPATDADGGVLASPSLTPDSNASPVNADADSWTTGGQEGSYLTQEVCQSASQTGLVVSGGTPSVRPCWEWSSS